MEDGDQPARSAAVLPKARSTFSHYLPRLRPEFYQADAIVFWTLPMARRATGWLNGAFLAAFREIMLHASAREGLLCPAYCLMPDHQHFVWMGLRANSDQRKAIRFLRTYLGPHLLPAKYQHQPYDHVLTAAERQADRFSLACADYVFLNPRRADLVKDHRDWPYSGALIPGYPKVNPFELGYWEWMWKRYAHLLEPGIQNRVLPPREMV
jgi:putative transposase